MAEVTDASRTRIDPTLAEFESKRASLLAAMEVRGLRAVQLQRTENLAWLTAGRVDTRVLLPSAIGIATVVVLRDGRCFYFVPDNEARRMAEEDYAELPFTAVTAPWYAGDPTQQVSSVAGPGPIAADAAADGASLLKELRASLTSPEMERYRWLAQTAAQATTSVLQSLEPGLTERTMAARVAAALHERGVEPSVLLTAVDDRILRYKHAVPQDATLERFGMLNLCARRWGLCVSISRFVHFGAMPQQLQDAFAVAAEVNARLLAATRTGARSADLFATAAATYAALGHAREELRHHQGGATGYAEREWIATPTGTEQVLNAQAFAWNPSVAGGKVEDTVLLKGGAIEVLTRTPELPVVSTNAGGTTIESAGVLIR